MARLGEIGLTLRLLLLFAMPPGLDVFFSHALAAEPQKRIHGPKEFIAGLDALAG